MKYKVFVDRTFSSAHALRGYQGRCERMHGHNWKVQVCISGRKLNKTGMLVDFVDIKKMLDGILEKLDHQDLNKVAPFNKINPTAENIAGYIYKQLAGKLKAFTRAGVKVASVRVWESETSSASAEL